MIFHFGLDFFKTNITSIVCFLQMFFGKKILFVLFAKRTTAIIHSKCWWWNSCWYLISIFFFTLIKFSFLKLFSLYICFVHYIHTWLIRNIHLVLVFRILENIQNFTFTFCLGQFVCCLFFVKEITIFLIAGMKIFFFHFNN